MGFPGDQREVFGLDEALSAGMVRDALTRSGEVAGFIDRNGNLIRQASLPWSAFLALTPAMVANEAVVYVYDKQSSFIWNALASRWFKFSGRLIFDAFDQLPVPSAKWLEMIFRVRDGIGIGGADVEVRKIGSAYFWRYTTGRAEIDATTTHILHTSAFNVEKLIRSKLLPRNNNKCIMQDGDKLMVRSVAARTAYATNWTRNFRFGALNTTSDTAIESLPSGTTHTIGEYNEVFRNDATHVAVLGPASSQKWAGSSSSDPPADVLVTNMDLNDCYFHYCLTQSADTNEGVKLFKGYALELIHAGG